jgi:hypothetical protein
MLLESDKSIFDNYFCSTAESADSADIVHPTEIVHVIQILTVDPQNLHPDKAKDLAECYAYWLFFPRVAIYYEALTSVDDKAKISVRR